MTKDQPDALAEPAPTAQAELARRLALAKEPATTDARGPSKRLLAGELSALLEPAIRPFRRLHIPKAANPKIVMLLPGFATHPSRMRYLASCLERAGHTVKRWGTGFNLGATAEKMLIVEQRLLAVHEKYGQKVVLVGWSLGGLYAREVACRHPHAVAKVVTMGTPFSGDSRANNAWRVYQAVAGHRVDAPPVTRAPDPKPPVETVALWSPRDGIISPRCARGQAHERDRAIGLRCTHIGFVQSKEAIEAVVRELDRE